MLSHSILKLADNYNSLMYIFTKKEVFNIMNYKLR
jgi:hypothetical protein